MNIFGPFWRVVRISHHHHNTFVWSCVFVCQSVGSAIRTVPDWATTIHTLTWLRKRARTARRSRHPPPPASLRSRRVSHSLSAEREACLHVACVFLKGKSLLFFLFFVALDFQNLNLTFWIRLRVPDGDLLALLPSWDSCHSVSIPSIFFARVYPLHCFCFLLCTQNCVIHLTSTCCQLSLVTH